MRAVQHGTTNVEIARRRGISVNAVKSHVSNALAKLAVPDRRTLRRWVRTGANVDNQLALGPLAQISRSVSDIAGARGVQFTHAPHMIHRHVDGTEEWMAFFEDPDARPMSILEQRRPD